MPPRTENRDQMTQVEAKLSQLQEQLNRLTEAASPNISVTATTGTSLQLLTRHLKRRRPRQLDRPRKGRRNPLRKEEVMSNRLCSTDLHLLLIRRYAGSAVYQDISAATARLRDLAYSDRLLRVICQTADHGICRTRPTCTSG